MTETENFLTEYVRSGSEQAFARLLSSYIDLVHSVALRSMNGDTHAAEDVTQTVFIDLARLARKLPPNVLLGGWLHRHTCYVASTMRRTKARRELRERIATEMNTPAENDFAQISPVLDLALNELPSADRDALVLRFFEQLDFRSVGAALGATEEAARKRVNRALERLQARLKSEGVTLSTVALGSALAAGAVSGAPAGLAATVLPLVVRVGSMAPAGSTAGLLKFMTASKAGIGLGTAVGLAGLMYSTVEHRKSAQLAEANRDLVEQITVLSNNNAEFSRKLMELDRNQRFGKEQLQELLRLRGQSGELKRELAALSRNANSTQRGGEASLAKDQQEAQVTGLRRMRDATIWMTGLLQYQAEHQNASPTNWDQLVPYIDNTVRQNGLTDPSGDLSGFLASTNQFELTFLGRSDAVTNTPGAIVLREKEAWPNPAGGWNRTYGFADGHTEVHRSEDGNFEHWERLHSPQLKAAGQ